MKLASFLTLATTATAADYRREISVPCEGQQHTGQAANLIFDNDVDVKTVRIGLDGVDKNDYNGLEVLMHHSSYKRPMRCGTKARFTLIAR